MSRDFGIRLLLMLFGVALGSLAAYGGARLVFEPKDGTTFENLDDLRRAMLGEADKPSSSKGVDLRAILNPHPDDRIIYDLRPKLDVTFQRVPVRTNTCAMRGVEQHVTKEPDAFRIALLGDSFAFGWGVDQGEIFASVLERILNEKAEGRRKIEVLNFGVPGYSTFQEVAVFRERALEFSPDAVLVYFIENDFGMPFFVKNVFNPGEISPGATFAAMMHKSDDERVEEQKKLLRSFDPSRALAELNAITRENGMQLFVAFNPRAKWAKDKKRLWAIDDKSGINVIPMFDELVRTIKVRNIDDKTLQLSDDPHPSAAKHELLAQILAPHFLYALK